LPSLINLPDSDTIIDAARRIGPYIHRTQVVTSQNLNEYIGARIFFKCENLQKAGVFKSRGATNAIFSLAKKLLNYGICTHSSGNHAAALSRAASLKNTHAHIVMPRTSSKVKISAVENYGGEITFCEPTLAAREETLIKVQKKTGAIEIHPYNNYEVIAGQATAAKELIEDVPELDVIMAPVGGGGLISGTALSTHYFSPGTMVIAAEPKGADDAYRSFQLKKFIPSVNPKTIADGLLTSLGSKTFPIILEYVHKIITVKESSIIQAMKLMWERTKIITEPSSAVPFAAILENKTYFREKRIGIIVSGGNIDLDRIPWVINTD